MNVNTRSKNKTSLKDIIDYIKNQNNIKNFPLCERILEIIKHFKAYKEKLESTFYNTDISMED